MSRGIFECLNGIFTSLGLLLFIVSIPGTDITGGGQLYARL